MKIYVNFPVRFKTTTKRVNPFALPSSFANLTPYLPLKKKVDHVQNFALDSKRGQGFLKAIDP